MLYKATSNSFNCRTPPYKDIRVTEDVKVYVQLVRPSDGKYSDPMDFTYKADHIYKQNKKRKANCYSSLESSSSK